MSVDGASDVNGGATLRPGATITVFGGSGFLGRHTVQALARRGYRVRVAVRRPNDAQFLRPMGVVGQVEPVQANIRDDASVAAAVAGADAVVNLVGILYESGRQKFAAVQADGATRVARAAAAAGVSAFVHVSAIGADSESPSAYARSKAEGEAGVRAAIPGAVILRPSIVFGPEDEFFNRFAALARLSPLLPLIGGGHTRFQPVYVKNVAEAIASAVTHMNMAGLTYELGGPEVLTFRELMERMLHEIARKRLLLTIPFALARLQAVFLQLLPRPLLTVDQVRQLAVDNVVSDAAKAEGRTLEGLGVAPTALASVLPSYLHRFRRTGQFERASAN
ncbi:MAG: complex I NDUFA9 subunit family protein [Parvibaculum sp.]|uniref:complex I NDUFA9 subunit family protein n=1 Tax=Parvibaculum sp. TaxID=2024848 RepID=UPI00349FEE63